MPAHPYIRTRGVRYNRETQCFEMWCPSCAEKHKSSSFWPLTEEFWNVHVLTICRACMAEKKRRDEKGRRALKRDTIVAANRAYYQENQELLRWKDNQRKAARRAQQVAEETPVRDQGAPSPV